MTETELLKDDEAKEMRVRVCVTMCVRKNCFSPIDLCVCDCVCVTVCVCLCVCVCARACMRICMSILAVIKKVPCRGTSN